MNLIANSGIQLISINIEIDTNDSFKMYFHEWLDAEDKQLKLELVHKYSDDIWVRKHNLFKLGAVQYFDELKDGRLIKAGTVKETWEEIQKIDEFVSGEFTTVMPENNDNEKSCFSIKLDDIRWEKLENEWLPMPIFHIGANNKSHFGPTNWCRFKLVPNYIDGKKRYYTLLVAFDTRTIYEDEDIIETPVFQNYERFKEYSMCNNEFSLLDFCSKLESCDWVDECLINVFYGVHSLDDLRLKKPKLKYMAQYIFLLRYIQQMNLAELNNIKLFSDRNVAHGVVDLVVDMGNSRTCAVLFDNRDFTRVENLQLQNFSNPVSDSKLNKTFDPFDMRLAFHEAKFGKNFIKRSKQFIYPSFVRLGDEANELIHKATNLNVGIDKITTFSSPKRFLWDSKPQINEWEFITLDKDLSSNIWIDGISEQINSDGTLSLDESGGIASTYSRSSLMTFAFLEILSQARMQINSFEFRHKWGNESTPRRIDRMIITCPTAMSNVEQLALRRCAEDAAIILDRFHNKNSLSDLNEEELRKRIEIIPSSKSLSTEGEDKQWIYDEATCTQFVYLYSEINKRYRNNSSEFFKFYGKSSGNAEVPKKLTIGSVDIGAGTTDLMIANYTYQDSGHCVLKPDPLFWESFYLAGDDLLKDLIKRLVIEAGYGPISARLNKERQAETNKLINDFFGEDNARMSVTARQIRSEFNLQASIPIVTKYLELLGAESDDSQLSYDDVFIKSKPTSRVLDYFKDHFGFDFTELVWNYNKKVVASIVEGVFESLVSKLSAILSHYQCDIVLLSGRPSGLKPIADLFLKYYAADPNRIITLGKYRVGKWYPFQDGNGYFRDSKSVVAVGAMIGYHASVLGSLNGFALDLSSLTSKMVSTCEYFSMSEIGDPIISPELNNCEIQVPQLPWRIWTRQLNSKYYPTRPFYKLNYNYDKIEQRVKNKNGYFNDQKKEIKEALDLELKKLKQQEPFKFSICRDSYTDNKEDLKIDSVENRIGDDISSVYFLLQIQSMSEDNNYWMDSGIFNNLKTT